MAKTVEKKEKKKAPDFKDTLYGIVGQSLANELANEVYHIKVEGMPECVIVTENGIDYTISITQKKTNVEYDDDHVKATFTPVDNGDEDIIDDDSDAENE